MKNLDYRHSGSLPATINIHLTRACNFKCRYCYAVFPESDSPQLSQPALLHILEAIANEAHASDSQVLKVNFAGGEPLLYPGLLDAVRHCKALGLRTSIVTNGSRLEPRLIQELAGTLDILALSIDSVAPETNRQIGRCAGKCLPDLEFYLNLAAKIQSAGIRLKVNTVVNRFNLHETLGSHIARIRPFRWKILQVKKIFGQNDRDFAAVAVSESEFQDYVSRNSRHAGPSTVVVPETSEDMTVSYAMIAPNGCFFDNGLDSYEYSQPIIESGLKVAFQQVRYSQEQFEKRGGLYV